jgi:hypothetical protein
MKNKYSIILGTLSNTCDRFCKGYKSNPTTEEMLEIAVKKISSFRLDPIHIWLEILVQPYQI